MVSQAHRLWLFTALWTKLKDAQSHQLCNLHFGLLARYSAASAAHIDGMSRHSSILRLVRAGLRVANVANVGRSDRNARESRLAGGLPPLHWNGGQRSIWRDYLCGAPQLIVPRFLHSPWRWRRSRVAPTGGMSTD